MVDVTAPVKTLKGLILREQIASATYGDEKLSVSLSNGMLIFETEKGKYGVKIEDIMMDILKMEKGGLL